MGTMGGLNTKVVNGSCIATHNLRANTQKSKLKKKYYTQFESPRRQLSPPSITMLRTSDAVIIDCMKSQVWRSRDLRGITFISSFVKAGQPVRFKEQLLGGHTQEHTWRSETTFMLQTYR